MSLSFTVSLSSKVLQASATLLSFIRPSYCARSILVLVLVMGSNSSLKAEVACEVTNSALESMPEVQVTLHRQDNTTLSIAAKLANNNLTRAAGFQRVCAQTIAEMPILFVLSSPQKPSFHMNNVVAPIDIAFIRKSSEIDSIRNMFPYSILQLSKPLYSPDKPVIAALEVRKGFFEDNDIGRNDKVTWSLNTGETQN